MILQRLPSALVSRIKKWQSTTGSRLRDIRRGIFAKRSPLWDDVRREFLKRNPRCAACESDVAVEAHHVKAFHTHPESELVLSNLRSLCDSTNKCHLQLGHCKPSGTFSWKTNNPAVDDSIRRRRREMGIGNPAPDAGSSPSSLLPTAPKP